MIRKIALCSSLLLLGCGEGVEGFQDRLSFGTGIGPNGYTLVGESTTFSLRALAGKPVTFRLESVADIEGRFLRLRFDDAANHDYRLPQAFGNITLSTFAVDRAGKHRVEARYVKPAADADQETLVAGSTLTITE